MWRRARAVVDWLAKPFKSKNWCSVCRCVHLPSPAAPDLSEDLAKKIAKALEEEVDRVVLADIEARLADVEARLERRQS